MPFDIKVRQRQNKTKLQNKSVLWRSTRSVSQLLLTQMEPRCYSPSRPGWTRSRQGPKGHPIRATQALGGAGHRLKRKEKQPDRKGNKKKHTHNTGHLTKTLSRDYRPSVCFQNHKARFLYFPAEEAGERNTTHFRTKRREKK